MIYLLFGNADRSNTGTIFIPVNNVTADEIDQIERENPGYFWFSQTGDYNEVQNLKQGKRGRDAQSK